MSSIRDRVLDAVKAAIVAALPNADVKLQGNEDDDAKARSIGPGGTVIIRAGDPGEPEVYLSPRTYVYAHRIPIEVAAFASDTQTPAKIVDAMLVAIGEQVDLDPSFGGLCDDSECEAPQSDDLETLGVKSGQWSNGAIIAIYGTPNPLT